MSDGTSVPEVHPTGWLTSGPATTALAVMVTVATWFPGLSLPAAGLDPSWRSALAVAATRDLEWGRSIVFTYGPWGYLERPILYSGSIALAAIGFALTVRLLLAFLLLRALQRQLPVTVAVLATWGVLAIATAAVSSADLLVAPGLIVGLGSLRAHGRRRDVLLVLLGVMGGGQLLIKLTGGLVLLAVSAAVLVFGRDRRRAAAWLGTALLGTFLVGWIAAGQPLGGIWPYLRTSIPIASGYSSAMNLADERGSENWYAVVATGVFAAGVLSLARAQPGTTKRLGIVLLASGWLWVVLRMGFTRHDGHDVIFFGLVLAAFAALPMVRGWSPAGHLTAVVLLAALCLSAMGDVPSNLLAPISRAQTLVDDLSTVLRSDERTAQIDEARAAIRSGSDELPTAVLDALGDQSVAIVPVESTIAWAYPSLDWEPLPVFQSYSAYTNDLDDLNASSLSSDTGPDRILYEVLGIDGRYNFFESPDAEVARLCHYRELVTSGRWQVLERGPNRCARSRELSEQRVGSGDEISVPTARRNEIVVAHFSLSQPLAAKVQGLLLKPPPTYLDTTTTEDEVRRYRFVAGTAEAAHVMSVPDNLGYSEAFRPESFSDLAVTGGGWSDGEGSIVVRFEAFEVR